MRSISHDNIFDTITGSLEMTSELQMRSDLMIVIRDIIDEHFWTPKKAAEKLGCSYLSKMS